LVDLRAERVNRGLSVKDAAALIGVSAMTLRRAEDGTVPWARNAFKIAEFYGYQVTDVWPVEAEAA
jgi:transcriptional regulator with XRE-family HTH domain